MLLNKSVCLAITDTVLYKTQIDLRPSKLNPSFQLILCIFPQLKVVSVKAMSSNHTERMMTIDPEVLLSAFVEGVPVFIVTQPQ